LPPIYGYAGPHIKEVCSGCGAYIRFAPKVTIPSFQESKQMIWAITQDVELISEKKKEMGVFHPNLKGVDANIAYNNLHVRIAKHFCSPAP